MDTKACRFCEQLIPSGATKCPQCLSRQPGTLHRGAKGKLLAGVCAGLAEYLGVEAALVRVGFLVAWVLSFGLMTSAYLALWVLTPPSPTGTAPAYRLMDWLSDLFSPRAPRSSSPG
jgi:phage shock protein C